MAIAIDACAAQHQGDRREQQDRVAILPHPRSRGVALAVVADGMGGHTGGALAAEQVIHTARNNLEHFAPSEESARWLLENSMREAHTMIKASRFMNEKDPHSTAVMLLLQSVPYAAALIVSIISALPRLPATWIGETGSMSEAARTVLEPPPVQADNK